MRRPLFSLFIAFLVCLGAGSSLAQTSNYSRLIVFGDSLSDTGNLAFVDLPFPYDNNRISDGPVGVDFIAAHIGSNADRSFHLLGNDRGYNYAVAGGNILGTDPEDLTDQVDSYLARVNQNADSNALYVLIMGGNDLRGLRSSTNTTYVQNQISSILNKLTSQLNRLINAGAKAIVVSNVPNIGRLPETIERQSTDPNIVSRARSHTQTYNTQLAQALQSYRKRNDINLVLFNFYTQLENLITNAPSLGFNNTTQPCFDPDGFDIELACLINGFESRVFFDNVHPSSRTHQLISNALLPNLPALPGGQNKTPSIAPVISLLLD